MDHFVTVEAAVETLNRALGKDPEAIAALVTARVHCNADLADDETIQVGPAADDGGMVGLLGILNGIFGINPDTGVGWIAAMWNHGTIERFAVHDGTTPRQAT